MSEHTPPAPENGRVVVGWIEAIDLPEWDIRRLPAKIDTGARTSALHVEDMAVLPDGRVLFHVMLSRHHRHRRVEVCAPIARWGKVRSSSGHYDERCFVHARLRLGPIEKEIEISLVSRDAMIYRMLLGRLALGHDFLVDASRKRILTPRIRKP